MLYNIIFTILLTIHKCYATNSSIIFIPYTGHLETTKNTPATKKITNTNVTERHFVPISTDTATSFLPVYGTTDNKFLVSSEESIEKDVVFFPNERKDDIYKKNVIPFYPQTQVSNATRRVSENTDIFIKNIPDQNPEERQYRSGFVSNKRPDLKLEDIVKMEDGANRRTLDDIILNDNIRADTEAPPDILFISGKNNENVEAPSKLKKVDSEEVRVKDKGKPKLDCSSLNCGSAVNSVCGGKVENGRWRFRLFLNECYFRKVNCGFRYEPNRFKQVPLLKCKDIAGHYSVKPFAYKPMNTIPVNSFPKKPMDIVTRRSFGTRRSQYMEMDGSYCSHPCPASCTEEYQPECAVSSAGRRRVFLNHCMLDHNSCTYNLVWHRRPLSECVGGKMADMHQSRAFINWMQKVGIVDNTGRLVLS